MLGDVIYLKDILREAKKEYEKSLKACGSWEDFYYAKGSLWWIVWKQLSDLISEKLKKDNHVWVVYGKKKVCIKQWKWEYVEHVVLNHFWDRVKEMEYRIDSKIFPILENKLGKYKSIWEIIKQKNNS